jgi:hypothetical protein
MKARWCASIGRRRQSSSPIQMSRGGGEIAAADLRIRKEAGANDTFAVDQKEAVVANLNVVRHS